MAITATINWPESDSRPSVDPSVIQVAGPSIPIQWVRGTNVGSFSIKITNPEGQFNPTQSPPDQLEVNIMDANTNSTEYSYIVTVTNLQGETVMFDPKIQNGAPIPP